MKVTNGQILEAIRRYRNEHGYSPSMREVGASVGIKSPSAIKYRLGRLRQLGLVSYEDGMPRTLKVVE